MEHRKFERAWWQVGHLRCQTNWPLFLRLRISHRDRADRRYCSRTLRPETSETLDNKNGRHPRDVRCSCDGYRKAVGERSSLCELLRSQPQELAGIFWRLRGERLRIGLPYRVRYCGVDRVCAVVGYRVHAVFRERDVDRLGRRQLVFASYERVLELQRDCAAILVG